VSAGSKASTVKILSDHLTPTGVEDLGIDAFLGRPSDGARAAYGSERPTGGILTTGFSRADIIGENRVLTVDGRNRGGPPPPGDERKEEDEEDPLLVVDLNDVTSWCDDIKLVSIDNRGQSFQYRLSV